MNSIVNVEVCVGVGFGVGQYEHTFTQGLDLMSISRVGDAIHV